MRKIINWNEDWYFSKGEKVQPDFSETWMPVTLPHTWNAEDGQDGGNDYWRGTACYAKAFKKPELPEGNRVLLEVQGAAMTAEVFLNGEKLAHHEGGYSTFRVDLTEHLREENILAVTVDNSENDYVYPQKADFTFYGGLYRNVNLIIVPAEHFELTMDGTPGLKITPVIDLSAKSAVVKLEAWSVGGQQVHFFIGDKDAVSAVSYGYACAEITLEDVHLWNGTEDPYLYQAKAILLDDGQEKDTVSLKFGCRKLEFDPQKGFSLNGRSYPLRGVSRHQDKAGVGNALTREDHELDMKFIREIGANTVRLAHYQHAQEFYDLCDEQGILVWAEIPYITMHMPNGRQNTLDQMRELITQCHHHPSIICWGLSNEITASGKVTEDLMENHRELNTLCHQMDPTRPTTMAHAFMLEQEHPLVELADIGSYNLYFGWYLGELEQNDSFFDEYHSRFPDRVMGFSEYGADANPQFHTDLPERGDYSEEFQCVYHEHLLKCIEERPWMWATHVWNLFDFAADGRDEGGKHGVNQKGLVTMDRKLRKDAFYLYKAAWNHKEPFVHLCGSRYVERCGDTTKIKVYSNQQQVTLLVDGREAGTCTGNRIFVFTIPLTEGEHRVEAMASHCSDVMTIRKAAKENPAYSFWQKGDVINWFDKETFCEDCYSLRDTFGTLLANPESAKLVNAVMAKARAARGDVAKSTAQNQNLQKMMSGIRMENLLKQAGPALKADDIIGLNQALQKIKKS